MQASRNRLEMAHAAVWTTVTVLATLGFATAQGIAAGAFLGILLVGIWKVVGGRV